MSASENQAAEVRMDIGARKIGPTGNKIRIRLPPRKRLAEHIQTMNTGVPGDTKNHPAKEVPAHTDKNTESTTFVKTKLKIEEVSTKPLGEGNYEEVNVMSKDRLCEEANFIVPSLNMTTTMGNGLPPEESSNMPRKKLSITSIMKRCEGASKNILNKELLYETNSNTSSKGVTEGTEISNQSKNLKTSAVNCEDENDNSVGNNLFEEAKKNIDVKPFTKAVICSQSRRLPDQAYDKKSSKKLCISALQTTDTSQNTSAMELSTSAGLAVEQSTSTAFLESAKEYKEFEDKVKRTIYLDNLSPQATDAVIKIALNQFGNVRNVNFLTNYTIPFDIPQSALVEMETEQDAISVVNMLDEFPFMISGMPRPVRVKRATVEMFSDRPSKPGRKLEFRWVGSTDPDYHDVRKFKLMCKRREAENLALIKNQLHEDASLAKYQQENLNFQSRKLEAMDSVILSGWVSHLTNIYNFRFDELY